MENWVSQDVGSPAITGSTSYNQATDTFTIQGAGTQIDGVADSFQFAYLPLVGNVEIITRVVSQTNSSGYANAKPPTTHGSTTQETSACKASPIWMAHLPPGPRSSTPTMPPAA